MAAAEPAAPTFDEVDAHVRSFDPSAFAARAPDHLERARTLPSPAEVLKGLVGFGRAVRPILLFFRPVMPPAWKPLVDGFCAAVDTATAIGV